MLSGRNALYTLRTTPSTGADPPVESAWTYTALHELDTTVRAWYRQNEAHLVHLVPTFPRPESRADVPSPDDVQGYLSNLFRVPDILKQPAVQRFVRR